MYLTHLRTYLLSAWLLWASTSVAQLGYSKHEIIQANGYSYQTGQTADSETPQNYIYYTYNYTSAASGNYTSAKAYYFNSNNYCSMVTILEPASETNNWVVYLNKHYVREGSLRWVDYSKGVVYKIVVEEKLCIVSWEYN